MAHAAVGYAIGRAWAAPRFGVTFGGRAPYAGVVLATVALSLLPDLDAAVGILAGFYGRSETCEAIAQDQNRSVNAIRLSLSRLRKQLHDCMSRQLPLLEARG